MASINQPFLDFSYGLYYQVAISIHPSNSKGFVGK